MMIVLAYLLSFVCLVLNLSLFIRLKPPYSFTVLWLPQVLSAALSPALIVIGLLGAGLGWLTHAPVAVVAGLLSAGISIFYIWRVLAVRYGMVSVFGEDGQRRIAPERASRMLKRRWSLGLPRVAEPRWERDLAFYTIPGTDRDLLCDIWQPPEGVTPSGLALIYLHGSGWYTFDKDLGTRPLFRHLAAQGHVVMDVAYRLCPEVDIYGMVGDVKRAVAWMKANAARYGVDPERIVVGGGSAGGHLALLAAYTPDHPQLTPPDVQGGDLSVRAVVSYYGPSDLRAVYEHTNQSRLVDLPRVEIGLPGAADMKKEVQDAGRVDMLVGGHPHEVPAVYDLASPVAHVSAACPPTLLIQGELDVITPAAAAIDLHRALVDCDVPAVNVVYPLTNHAFDLLLPHLSPAAQASLYEVERFLALMV